MISDHAILLKRDNFDTIKQELPITDESLEELLADMLKESDGPWYVIFYRRRDGQPTWVVLTEEELQQKYDLETIESSRFTRKFERIVA